MITVEQPEHSQLRASVRRLLERETPLSKVISDAESEPGFDRAVWERLSREIGVAGLAIPGKYGGADATVIEQAVVAGEFGRYLTCAPSLSSAALATQLLLRCDNDEARERWLPAIAEARCTGAAVYRGAAGEVASGAVPVTATRSGDDGWRLSGQARFVLDGHSADLLLVVAKLGQRLALFLVLGAADGMRRHRMASLDQTRALAEVRFDETPAELLDDGDAVWAHLEYALDIATVLLSAEQLGGAERVLEMAVDYAKMRRQFGRTIASFQAIKHRCADLAIDIDRARSAVVHATWSASAPVGARSLPAASSTAALVCSQAYDRAAQENVQIHGGIGFTWEHPAHRYFRRAKSDAVLLADRAYHTDRLLGALGIEW